MIRLCQSTGNRDLPKGTKIQMTSLATATKKATTRRRGRPPVDNPLVDRRVARLSEAEGRRLNRYMHQRGIDMDSELIRSLILQALDSAGVEDPGPDSPEALPTITPRRKRISAPPQRSRSDQLALTA